MNKVITINLGGNAYQVEDAGYDALRRYLDEAARRLATNPDKDEILSDIERAIAEKFRAVLGPNKSVVVAQEVEAIVAEMGPVGSEADPKSSDSSATERAASENNKDPHGTDAESTAATRRLYRIPEGAMLLGVCNGFGAYFAVDAMLVRLILVAAVIFTALFSASLPWLFAVAYAALSVFLPVARTPDELAARGAPSTTRDFIRRAQAGYYEAMRALADKESHHELRKRFKSEMRSWKRALRARDCGPGWQNHAGSMVMPGFALPLLGLVEAAIAILTIIAIFQLVTRHHILGVTVPSDIPIWIAVVALIFAVQIITWPIKVIRHTFQARLAGAPYPIRLYPGFLDTLVWVAALVAGVWLADRYIPGVHGYIVDLPPKLQTFADSMQAWWNHTTAPADAVTTPVE